VGRLTSHLDPRGETYLRGEQRMRALCDGLQARLAQARAGGGADALERHRGRGKLPVRERIDLLLDPDTAWLELSPLAALGLYDD
jgi:3-methylcrotonyl-CoA carboxylase beta subunit